MAKPKTTLRMTRRLDAGIIKIRDKIVDKDGKESFLYHVLGVKHSPKRAMVNRKKKVPKKDKPGEYDRVDIPNDFIPAKDANGKPVWQSYGETFEVNDVDFVMASHGGILEKV